MYSSVNQDENTVLKKKEVWHEAGFTINFLPLTFAKQQHTVNTNALILGTLEELGVGLGAIVVQ